MSRSLCLALLVFLTPSAGSTPLEREIGPAPPDHSAAAPAADTFLVVPEESLFAVVTRRAGPLARFAHDHMVVAEGYEAHLVMDPDNPTTVTFEMRVRAAELVAHDAEWKARVEDRLVELGILDGPFQSVSDRERRSIREAMLGPDQLDADKHPEIHFRAEGARPLDDGHFAWELELEMTLRGVTRTTSIRGRLDLEGERLKIEATGTFRFTDFGLEPYSAYLGAVRNRDPFHLYLRLVAEPSSSAGA